MSRETSQKPNVLLIMADQMTPFLMGAYGHQVVKTPNLDRLVEGGVRFDSAYSPCPLCAPARASMVTGKYVSNIRCYDNATPLSCDEPTFAHYLSNEGYETVASGKMHFIGPDQLHGFRTRLTADIYPSDFKWTKDMLDDRGRKKALRSDFSHSYRTPNVGVRPWSQGLRYDEETHFRAMEYLYDKGQSQDAPFLLLVSYQHPHEPFHVTKDLWDMYGEAQIDIPEYPENLEETFSIMDRWLNKWHNVDEDDVKIPESLYNLRRSYYGLVTYVDNKIGELVQALEDNGLRDNTVVVFTSDHGDMLGEKGMVQKRYFYEWSVRIPLIVRFPDGWKSGGKVSQHVSLMDLMPTMLDFAGVEEKDRLPVDGKSVMELIDGSDTSDREVFSEYHIEGVLSPCFMIRSGKYKYIYIHNEESQLFDLEEDPKELTNLCANPAFRDVEQRLRSRILEEFDPDDIERDTVRSLRQRLLIKEAMIRNSTHWDYSPNFDTTKQYVR